MIKEEINKLVAKSLRELQKEKKLPDSGIPEILVEHPLEESHGDYAVNIALRVAKKSGKPPIEIARLLKAKLEAKNSKFFREIKVAEPGFINFFISDEYLKEQIAQILKEKDKFGSLKIGKGQKINVEFISANPTGPLTLGNGRGGFCGDVLANILKKAGYKVVKEYYINDVGEQIRKLGHSVIGDNQAVYKGDYIKKLRKKLLGSRASQLSVEKVGEKAAKIILTEMIKPTIKKMGIEFDVWFSEKSLYQKKKAEKTLDFLKKKKLAYEKDGALWFLATKFGDDKDRVLVRKNGEPTYFASDIAYLKNKFERDFDYLIFFWGADHAGYVDRLKGAAEALGYSKNKLKIIVMQLVHLFRKGKQVRMSKREGVFVTLDELIDEVGLDVARFFFLERRPGSHLNFDMDLAKEKSEKNPVYYVQYAHARICSILRKCKTQNANPKMTNQNLKILKHSAELELIKQLIKFPEIVGDTAEDYQVQRIPQYAVELADTFHKFYENCQVLCDDKNLQNCRLSLVSATKIVLKNTLDLMGISAPEKM